METTINSGKFSESLRRNNSKIREDRANAIIESAQLLYKRSIEDMQVELKKLKRDQENILDLSPNDTNSLKVASDFNAKEFVEKDQEIGMKIRNLQIRLDVVEKRYAELFGA